MTSEDSSELWCTPRTVTTVYPESRSASLGDLYVSGHGVPQDDVMAHMWVSLAAASSYRSVVEEAQRNRDNVAHRMTPDQIDAAQRLASEREPQSE